MPSISLQEKTEEHRCFSNTAMYFYMNLQTLKIKHIVAKFSHIHTLKDNILDFVWAALVLKNIQKASFLAISKSYNLGFSPSHNVHHCTLCNIDCTCSVLTHIAGKKHSHCELPFFPASSATQKTAQ